jgi:hypothetical protein
MVGYRICGIAAIVIAVANSVYLNVCQRLQCVPIQMTQSHGHPLARPWARAAGPSSLGQSG